jgi:hypothetical protein
MTAELNRMSMRLSERSKALQIWDTGSGIAEDQLEKKFRRVLSDRQSGPQRRRQLPIIRRALELLARSRQFQPVVCETGEQALQQLARQYPYLCR